MKILMKIRRNNKNIFANDDLVAYCANLSTSIEISKFMKDEIKCTSSPARMKQMKIRQLMTKNIKKVKSLIKSNPFRGQNNDDCPVKLLNFNYNNSTCEATRAKHPIACHTPILKRKTFNKKEFNLNPIDDSFSIFTQNRTENNTSTPIRKYSSSRFHSKHLSTYYQSVLDEDSTQIIIDNPVLIESTFNNSSCSNISDDLIIVEHRKCPRKLIEIERSWNSMMINRYHDNTNASFNEIPSWANGNQLNLALVNQLYFNPSANGVFQPTKHKEINGFNDLYEA
jgi:hypothetical protein